MTGFKSGNTDLWDDDENEQSEEVNADSDNDMSELTPESKTSTGEETEDERDAVPYITRRRSKGESTTWQRSRLTFYVRDHVEDGERELKRRVEDELGEEVSKFDLREAVYLLALDNPDGVVDQLEEMGVGYEL